MGEFGGRVLLAIRYEQETDRLSPDWDCHPSLKYHLDFMSRMVTAAPSCSFSLNSIRDQIWDFTPTPGRLVGRCPPRRQPVAPE